MTFILDSNKTTSIQDNKQIKKVMNNKKTLNSFTPLIPIFLPKFEEIRKLNNGNNNINKYI